MRILVVADLPKDPDSGSAGTVYQTTLALRELGHEVDEVWATDLPHRIRHGNLHLLLERPRAYRDAVRRRTAERDYDVIQVSHAQAYLAALDHRRRRRPGVFVARSHGVEPHVDATCAAWRRRLGEATLFPAPRSPLTPVIQHVLHRQWKPLARAADGIIVGCSMDRAFLVEQYGLEPARLRAIPHGIAPAFVSSPPRPMSGERLRRVLYVGQTIFQKGPDVLVRAMHRLLAARPDVRFTWVCARSDHPRVRAAFEAVRAGGASVLDRVAVEGWRPQGELVALYDAHGIFVWPSFFEGFGKAPLEAMARGMCVVASNVGGQRDTIADGVSGFLVEPGDVDGFVRRIVALLEDPALAARMAAAARATAEGYTWRRCAEEAVAFYGDLLDMRKARR